MTKLIENQLDPRFMGVVGMQPLAGYISASRLAMYCNHVGQSLTVEGATVKRMFTGVEREYAKAVHDIRFPCNATVLRIIPKYAKSVGSDLVGDNNPMTSIIYENVDSPIREVGVLHIPHHHCIHQHFGFNYVPTENMARIYPGANIPAGTVIATAPNVTPEGDLMFGLGMQVAMMSLPAVIEDGVIASESAVRRMTTKGYGVRTVSWGKSSMPLNLYGGPDSFKPFPNIGEYVAPNALLFASRRYEEMLSVPLMSRKALRTLDVFDEPVYAKANARVVDIIVYCGSTDRTYLPSGMDDQLMYYYLRSLQYHEAVLAEYNRLRREAEKMGGNVTVSPELNQLLVDAIALTTKNNKDRKKVVLTENQQPIDEWVVKIVFEYDIVPTNGFKITGMSGDKGVLCEIRKDEDMPVDASGTRAELIMDSDSTIKRMNVGRLYEQYISAAAAATVLRLSNVIKEQGYAAGWNYLMGFYGIVSPLMIESINEILVSDEDRKQHIDNVLSRGIYIYTPPNNPVSYRDVIRNLRDNYPAVNGPVTFKGTDGQMVTTKSNVIIGEMYIMLLEKIGNTWAGVSSAKLQHFGIPAKLNSDKYSSPGRHNPVRTQGESEFRLVAATCGGETAADILDQNNNPQAHANAVENILEADEPTNLRSAVNRELIPRGNGRILTFIRHILECGGFRFTRGENAHD